MTSESRDHVRKPPEGGTQSATQNGDLVEVEIAKIVPRGFGLGFADGLTVFVTLPAVGDKVSARVTQIKGKTAFAEIERVIEPGPQRITPPCPYVGTCGGCDFQQMTYAAQLEAKVGIIRDNLHRIGKVDYESDIPIIASPEQFQYRLRAQFHIDADRQEIGYYERNSQRLVPVEHCPILVPELDDALQTLRREFDWASFWPEKGAIDAACGDKGEVSLYSPDAELGDKEIVVSAAGERYYFAAHAFFQGNKYLLDTLIHTAIGDATGTTALDLYSGVGLFTLPLARKFARVVSVEDYQPAVEFAMKNVEAAGLENVEIENEAVGKFLARQVEVDIDFALLDPPRFGTEKQTVLDLIRLRPRVVSYVSCDASVLARDLRRFLDNGYAIASITALDLFPQTHHVETVVRLAAIE